MLVSAGVGFAIGVLVTAAFAPLMNAVSHHKPGTPTAGPTPVALTEGQLQAKVTQLADSALLGYAASGQHRVERVALTPGYQPGRPPIGEATLYNVALTFGLNSNEISPTIQTLGVKIDCFLVLKALYTHDLPLNNVELFGTFRFPHRAHNSTVMVAGSSLYVESRFSWKSISPPSDTKRVWANLSPNWIAKRFQQYVPPVPGS